MPTIAIFYGIVIQMYWRDHGPPHFHALYQGYEAQIAIETGEVIAGRMPANARHLIQAWVMVRRPELMENWHRARRREPLERIAGPEEE